MELNVLDQIEAFHDFIEKYYYSQLLENARKGIKYLAIDFSDISKWEPDIANDILEYPEETIKVIEKSIETFDIQGITSFRVGIHNLPNTNNISIREIRSNHLGRLWSIYGVVRQLSDIIPTISYVKYECPVCGNVIGIISPHGSKILKEPSKCACGRKGNFVRIDKEMTDVQRLVIEESSEMLEGNQQPKRLGVMLRGEQLTNPGMEGVTRPGNRVIITGILYDNPKFMKNIETIERDFMFDAMHIKPTDDEYSSIQITHEDEKKIIEFSEKHNVMDYLVSRYAPKVYGNDIIKESIILQQFGSVTVKTKHDKEIGELHILLIGDTGLAKSRLIKFAKNFAPKSYFGSGDSSTGIGLTFAVEKDEFLQTWALKAGPMVLAHKGTAIIDELDKFDEEDTKRMHSCLASGEIVVNKASIQNVTLLCETALLSACNPKDSRFDPYHDLSAQIELPITLINRFDLIFPMQEKIDAELDRNIAKKMLESMKANEVANEVIDKGEYDFIKKYILYSKRIIPEITHEIEEKITEFFVQARQRKTTSTKSVPITARQLASLAKLVRASARARLSKVCEMVDFEAGKRILMYFLEKLALDPETGVMDIDRIAIGTTAQTRNKVKVMIDILNELTKKLGKTVPIDDVVIEATKHEINESEIEDLIEKLKRSGDIIEPKRGFLMVI